MVLLVSGFISLFIQFVTGIIDIYGLTIKVPKSKLIFIDILKVELGVQTIEFIFYAWMVLNLQTIKNITPYRYFDWFITTPIMLISLLAYLGNKSYQSMIAYIKENKNFVLEIVALNVLMLFFGLMGELKYIKNTIAVLLGFIPFVYYFKRIYDEKIDDTTTKDQLVVFWFFLFFWSLYGVSALLSYKKKNVLYNILDLFAKNGFGLFLVYILWINRIQ